MKNLTISLSVLFISIALPAPILAASSAQTSAASNYQAAFHNEKKPKERNFGGKRFRIPFNRKYKSANENPTYVSNGGIALFLLLSCLIVALALPGFAMLSIVFYLTGVFFAVIGVGKDKNKTPSIIAILIAAMPFFYFAGWIIYCRRKGCFD